MGHTLQGEQIKKRGGGKTSLFHLVYSIKNYKPLVFPPRSSSSQTAGTELSWGGGDQSGDPRYAKVTSALDTEGLFRDSLSPKIGQSPLHPERNLSDCVDTQKRGSGGRGHPADKAQI